MAAWPNSSNRKWPTWWRRVLVASRRANLFRLLEVVCAFALVAMVASSWFAFSSAPQRGGLVPAGQLATLLIGTLILYGLGGLAWDEVAPYLGRDKKRAGGHVAWVLPRPGGVALDVAVPEPEARDAFESLRRLPPEGPFDALL